MLIATVGVHVRTRRKNPAGVKQTAVRVRNNTNRLAYNYAQRIEGGSKRRVHVITGRLKESIHRERLGLGRHRVTVGAEYGMYEEYGTRYRPPHPFFRPAIAEAKAQYDREKRSVFRA